MLGEILAVQTSYVMADYTTARQHDIKVIEIARQLASFRFEAQGVLYRGKLDQPRIGEASVIYDALNEGERMLEVGSVSHSHFLFYPDAIERFLDIGDWDGAERYASALEEFTKAEPLPWSEYFIARGRVLATFGRRRRDKKLMAEIKRRCQEAERSNIERALPALEVALNST